MDKKIQKAYSQVRTKLLQVRVEAHAAPPCGEELHLWGDGRVVVRKENVENEGAIGVGGVVRGEDEGLEDVGLARINSAWMKNTH